MSFATKRFISRNAGYVSEELQSRIRKTRLLIAGCGIGSTIAEACVRLGFEHLTLIDKDQVEEHNLNRQDFTACDIGTQKVDALARRLLSINPSASIRAINEWVTPENAAGFVNRGRHYFRYDRFLEPRRDCGLARRRSVPRRNRSLRRYPRGGGLPPSIFHLMGHARSEAFSACPHRARSEIFRMLVNSCV